MSPTLRERAVPLGPLAAMQLSTDSRDSMHVCETVDQAIGVLADALLEGGAVELDGIGVIEVVERGSRRVRANFLGPDAPLYETGPRIEVRLRVNERFQRKMSEAHRERLAERREEGT